MLGATINCSTAEAPGAATRSNGPTTSWPSVLAPRSRLTHSFTQSAPPTHLRPLHRPTPGPRTLTPTVPSQTRTRSFRSCSTHLLSHPPLARSPLTPWAKALWPKTLSAIRYARGCLMPTSIHLASTWRKTVSPSCLSSTLILSELSCFDTLLHHTLSPRLSITAQSLLTSLNTLSTAPRTLVTALSWIWTLFTRHGSMAATIAIASPT